MTKPRRLVGLALILAIMALGVGVVLAQPGTLLGTVTLPGNGGVSVGGTFDGTYYIAPRFAPGDTLDIYLPPPGGNGAATLVATKTLVDAVDTPVEVSAISWDASRNMLWGTYGDPANVYLIDIGDPTVGGDALATLQFSFAHGGITLIDGLAWDTNDDTLYLSPDVDDNVYHLALDGTLLNTVTPMNAAGEADGLVSGVAIGADNTLYIGRNGEAEIRRVDKTTGAWIADFATTSGRVEDLVCDPVTYAPNEAILAKDAFSGLYEAFEVEPGTCPLPPQMVSIDVRPQSCPNPVNTQSQGVLPVAILGSADFDVSEVDVSTVMLAGVSPLRWSIEDVATPFMGDISDPPDRHDCTDEGADGFMDLTLKFDTQAVIAAIGPMMSGDVVVVQLTGELTDGTPFVGEDVIWIR